MQKKIMQTVEDYLECIVDAAGNYSAPIKLARYDVNIVSSFAAQISDGLAFTDRQAELAHKIVVKYKKQLAQRGVELGTIEQTPVYRNPIRTVDRSRKIKVVGNSVHLLFPYNPEIIDHIRQSGSGVAGSLEFDRSQRLWIGRITEPRALWLTELVDKYQFAADETFLTLVDRIKNCQDTDFGIRLVKSSNGFKIENAADSLMEYVNENFGHISHANILDVMDSSSILGFTVDEHVKNQIIGALDPKVQKLILEKQLHMPLATKDNLESIFYYAQLVGRDPLFVYDPMADEPSRSVIFGALKEKFGQDLLVVGNRQRKLEMDGARCVYITNWQPSWQMKIPLLISLTGMMIGPRKQQILQNSDKVVYMTDVVYNDQ